jgi:ligand-binding sensor domain-containing protein
VATIPSLSGVAGFAGRVLLCKDDGEVAPLDRPRGKSYDAGELVWTRHGAAQTASRLLEADGRLWLLGSRGLKRAADESRQISFRQFGETEPAQAPTSNVISALAFDAGGRLWAGSFREGLDVFAPSGARLAHLETDELREINSLTPAETGGVLAATSQGVARLDPALKAVWLKTADGLASNSVMHVAPPSGEKQKEEGQLVAATSRGLSLGPPGRMRALTTVQGLPSNSVYAVWREAGRRVYAGTLGGLAEISAGRVERVFKDSNSALTHNWVTAVRGAAGRLFVGTYGGGVFELLPSGGLRGFANETGKAFVNPNAMWADDERLYVGTLEGALVLNLATQKWRRVRAELPAPTVLSVTGREGRVYFGTTGGLARFDTDFFKHSD